MKITMPHVITLIIIIIVLTGTYYVIRPKHVATTVYDEGFVLDAEQIKDISLPQGKYRIEMQADNPVDLYTFEGGFSLSQYKEFLALGGMQYTGRNRIEYHSECTREDTIKISADCVEFFNGPVFFVVNKKNDAVPVRVKIIAQT